ncbi:MAG: ATP-dependent metallopeptidase FtsH/Yme1/Tma family protein, partial [Paramuribaculum sp.]|nr:ATP-dependent metallopeptidase FtsH/Yme1/Tma family protein [Paramuribaculum sp.]
MNQKPKKSGFKLNMYWMYAIVVVFLIGILYLDDDSLSREVSYSKFENYVATGGVNKIIVLTNKNRAEGFLTDSLAQKVFPEGSYKAGSGVKACIVTDIPSADKLQDKIDQWQADGVFKGEVKFEKSSDYSAMLWTFGPVVLLIGFWFVMMRRMSGKDGGAGGGVFSVGKSKAKIFDKDGPIQVTFKDVAGLSEAKTEIQE